MVRMMSSGSRLSDFMMVLSLLAVRLNELIECKKKVNGREVPFGVVDDRVGGSAFMVGE
jgi:hypothetical protein